MLSPRSVVVTIAALLSLLAFASASASAKPRQVAPNPNGPAATIGKANLRSKPGGGRVIKRLRAATPLTAVCTRVGGVSKVAPDGLSRLWVKVKVGGRNGWIHDALVNPSRDALLAPPCGVTAATSTALPGVTEGTCAVKPVVDLLPPFATPADFISAALPGARASRSRSRVPVSVTLAQGVLETGGGRIAALGNNYFGIKARATAAAGSYSWGGNAAGCTYKKTREAERSGLVLTIGAFRAYKTLRDSILDHGDLLTSNPVYAPAFAHTDDPPKFLKAVARRYATDPRYAGKLMAIIDRYDLSQYDD